MVILGLWKKSLEEKTAALEGSSIPSDSELHTCLTVGDVMDRITSCSRSWLFSGADDISKGEFEASII